MANDLRPGRTADKNGAGELEGLSGPTRHNFYGYTLRSATADDLLLALVWVTDLAIIRGVPLDPTFWLKGESFLVSHRGEPIAFFKVEHVKPVEVRLYFQASPIASPKTILRGITMLVPLIERGLHLRGAKAIFFTSHSLAMSAFMEKRLGYKDTGRVTADGLVMWKLLRSADERAVIDTDRTPT